MILSDKSQSGKFKLSIQRMSTGGSWSANVKSRSTKEILVILGHWVFWIRGTGSLLWRPFKKGVKDNNIWNLSLFITQMTKNHEVGRSQTHQGCKRIKVLRSKWDFYKVETEGLWYHQLKYSIFIISIIFSSHNDHATVNFLCKKKQKMLTVAGNELTYLTHLIYLLTIPV